MAQRVHSQVLSLGALWRKQVLQKCSLSDLVRQVSSDKNKLDFLEREFKPLHMSMQHKSQIWIHVCYPRGQEEMNYFSHSESF